MIQNCVVESHTDRWLKVSYILVTKKKKLFQASFCQAKTTMAKQSQELFTGTDSEEDAYVWRMQLFLYQDTNHSYQISLSEHLSGFSWFETKIK